jgi:hypothetical protein
MPPAADDHTELWDSVNKTDRLLAEHLGECRIRHAEIIRRQDESIRDRHGMNLKLDAIKTQMLTMMLTVAGTAIVVIASAALPLLLKR